MDQTGLHCIEMQVDGVFVAFCAVFDVTTCSLHLSPLIVPTVVLALLSTSDVSKG